MGYSFKEFADYAEVVMTVRRDFPAERTTSAKVCRLENVANVERTGSRHSALWNG